MTDFENPRPSKSASFKRRLGYAFQGIFRSWQREASFRFQCACAFAVLIFCLFVKPSALWCALFAMNVALVLALELINSAIEALLDRLHPEVHPEIGFVKDCLSGAVLIVSLGSILVFLVFLVTNWS